MCSCLFSPSKNIENFFFASDFVFGFFNKRTAAATSTEAANKSKERRKHKTNIYMWLLYLVGRIVGTG